jgi:hypothetical protein
MWESLYLTALLDFAARYRDSFTLFLRDIRLFLTRMPNNQNIYRQFQKETYWLQWGTITISCKMLTGIALLAFLPVRDEGLYPLGVANYPLLGGCILHTPGLLSTLGPYQETWCELGGSGAEELRTVWPSTVAASSVQALPTLFSYLSPSSCFWKYREFSNSLNAYSSLRPTPHVNSYPNFFPLVYVWSFTPPLSSCSFKSLHSISMDCTSREESMWDAGMSRRMMLSGDVTDASGCSPLISLRIASTSEFMWTPVSHEIRGGFFTSRDPLRMSHTNIGFEGLSEAVMSTEM